MRLLRKYWAFILLAILLILGFIIRSEGLFNNNVLFLYDDARDMLYVRNIVLNHHLYLIGPSSGGLQGYFHGVLWYYLLLIPFALGQGNPLAGTIFMIVGSLASIILAFFLMKKITNVYTATLAATLFAVSTFSVATSRYIWNPYPIVWLMPVYFYFAYQFVTEKKGFIWLALLTGLFIHFEAVYGIPLILPLLVLSFFELKRKKFKQFIIGAILFFLPMVPSLLFDLRHQFLISKSILNAIVSGGGDITHDTKSTGTPIVTRFSQRGVDLFTYTINSLTQNLWVNILLAITALFSLKLVKRNFLYISLLVLIAPFLFFLTMRYEVWSYYWIGETPYFVLLLSYLIGASPKKYLAVIAAVLIFLFSGYIQDLSLHKDGYAPNNVNGVSTEFAVADSIYKDAQGKPFSAYTYTPPVYDYVYEYIFWYKGYSQYHAYPINSQKQKTVYVISEPNPAAPSPDFFIKNMLHINQKPVKSWTVATDRIIKYQLSNQNPPVDPNIFPQF